MHHCVHYNANMSSAKTTLGDRIDFMHGVFEKCSINDLRKYIEIIIFLMYILIIKKCKDLTFFSNTMYKAKLKPYYNTIILI